MADDTQLASTFAPELEQTLQRVAGLSPKALLDVADDPKTLSSHARVMLMAQLGVLHKLSANPAFSVSQRLQFVDKLIRASGLNHQAEELPSADKLPQIVINVGDPGTNVVQNIQEKPAFPAKYLENAQEPTKSAFADERDDDGF